MEERAGLRRCAEERLVDRLAGEHGRERQVAAGEAFAARHQVGRDVDVVDRPHATGAADAGCHLVDDHESPELVAQRAHAAHERRVMGEHATGCLHERLDHDGAHPVALALENGAHFCEDLARACLSGLALRQHARGGHHAGVEQDRPVGRVEQLDTADAYRPEGVAVIALGDVDVERPQRPRGLRRRLERHLDRCLDGGRAVARVEHPGEAVGSGVEQPFGQLDAWLVGQAEEGRVVEAGELVAYRSVDLRHAVPVDGQPQRRDTVEIAVAVGVEQVHALGPLDHQRLVVRPGAVRGERVPHVAQVAGHQLRRTFAPHADRP